jgi:hypothetical protein
MPDRVSDPSPLTEYVASEAVIVRLGLLLRELPRQPAGDRQAGDIEPRRRVSGEGGRDRPAFPTPHQQHSSGPMALRRRGIIGPAKYYGAPVC